MITIKQPVIVQKGDKTRLECGIDIDGKSRNLWFEVDQEYGKYLCYERADAYIIALLPWAMRNNHDITAEIPVTEALHYQITSCLIPALVKAGKNLYAVQIYAAMDASPIPNEGAVGTGITCGIDSLHVMANLTNSPYRSLNITHLVHNNVGSHGINKGSETLRLIREQRAEDFAGEMGYKLIKNNSNFAELFRQDYPLIHTYGNCFAVYLLQKLWSVYFYASSGLGLNEFSLKNHETKDSAYYDLLTLSCFSTQSLTIYSEGAAKTRFEKTLTVINYLPARRYLNVCCSKGYNCGKCEKCMRTLLTLDALNALDDFSKVFDVDYYKTHRNQYYDWLCLRKLQKDPMLQEIFCILARRITLRNWVVGLKELFFVQLRKINWLYQFVQRLK